METRTILANALVVVARPVHRNHEKSSRSSSRASKSYKMSTYRLGSLGSTVACWCSVRIMLEGRNRAAVHVIGGPRKLHTLARWSRWLPGSLGSRGTSCSLEGGAHGPRVPAHFGRCGDRDARRGVASIVGHPLFAAEVSAPRSVRMRGARARLLAFWARVR